ncbi:hypothetical protein JTB14_019272 [Gonioctena quinquepunctata]|nr:hypothetical protein JTB14_019272 [Gonioctena quinquepunctata]
MSPNEEKSLKIFLKIILKKIKKNTRNEEPSVRKSDISNPDCPDTDDNSTIEEKHNVSLQSSQSTEEGMELTFDTNKSVSQNPECLETSETEPSKTGESLFENCSHEENANEINEKPETNSNEVSRSDYEISRSNEISKRKRVPSCESVNHIWSLSS